MSGIEGTGVGAGRAGDAAESAGPIVDAEAVAASGAPAAAGGSEAPESAATSSGRSAQRLSARASEAALLARLGGAKPSGEEEPGVATQVAGVTGPPKAAIDGLLGAIEAIVKAKPEDRLARVLPRLKAFLERNPEIALVLSGVGKTLEAANMAALFAESVDAFQRGEELEGFVKLVDGLKSAANLLPESAQKELLAKLGTALGPFLGKYGVGLVDLLQDLPKIAKLFEEIHDTGKTLENIRELATSLGPKVVGLLVQAASGSKTAGDAVGFVVGLGAKALDDLGRAAVAAQKNALKQHEIAHNMWVQRRNNLIAAAIVAGLEPWEATAFADVVVNEGPNVQHLLVELLMRGDAEFLRAVLEERKGYHNGVRRKGPEFMTYAVVFNQFHDKSRRAYGAKSARAAVAVAREEAAISRRNLEWYRSQRDAIPAIIARFDPSSTLRFDKFLRSPRM